MSPHIVSISPVQFEAAQKIIKSVHQVIRSPQFFAHVFQRIPEWLKYVPFRHSSLLNSFDFHVSHDGALHLIEINTNAAYSLGLYWQYEFFNKSKKIKNLFSDFSERLWSSVQKEFDLKKDPHVLIIDSNLQRQNFLGEFYLFQDFLMTRKLSSKIADIKYLKFMDHRIEFEDYIYSNIYNRSTDFYFDGDDHLSLKKSYEDNQVKISPHPWGHAFWAEKTNLDFFSRYNSNIEACQNLTQVDSEWLWENKKDYFFKESRSFASRGAHKGMDLKRVQFEKILKTPQYVFQKLVSPRSLPQNKNKKFDLRFYTYDDEILIVGARIFEGDFPKFKDEEDGFACIKIES